MSEQQVHLKNLLSQRDGLISDINELNTAAAGKRELLLRASGAIEYLQQIGIELPKEEETSATPEVEGEVVNAEGDIPEPTPEG